MQKRIKRGYCCSWQAAATLALVLVAWPVLAGEKQVPGDKVAVVNGSVITHEDFSRELRVIQERLKSEGRSLSDSQLSKLKMDIVEGLIDRELLYQESQKRGIKVEDSAIDGQFEMLKKRFSSESEFKNALNKMNLSEVVIKGQIRKGIATQQFIDKQFVRDTTVTNEEIKAYYNNNPDRFTEPEQVLASHILIKVDPMADKSQKIEARKEIEKIQERLRKGEDFATLAKEYSDCPSSAKGGDLGYFKRGQMVKPFEDAALGLKPGEVSEIVETKFGYHLIKVMGRKSEVRLAYKDVKDDDRLKEGIKQQKVRNKVTLYVDELKANAKVERFLTKTQ